MGNFIRDRVVDYKVRKLDGSVLHISGMIRSIDIPEGCLQCGGDYPRCVDSCPLYDD